ncbi:MAG TPA: hypothetical protein VFJ58_21170, partial [Armatimonadota bacterium]|nr:hypothetical protein [Armatimonadota bacterium]
MIRHVRALPLLFIAASVFLSNAAASYATSYGNFLGSYTGAITGTSYPLAAQAYFSSPDAGGDLTLELSNIGAIATHPKDVLTAVFFDYSGVTPIDTSSTGNSRDGYESAAGNTLVVNGGSKYVDPMGGTPEAAD